MFKKLSTKVLHAAEALYLFAHGWMYEDGFWSAPSSHPKKHKSIDQGHAVNSTKHYAYLGSREDNLRKIRGEK